MVANAYLNKIAVSFNEFNNYLISTYQKSMMFALFLACMLLPIKNDKTFFTGIP
jgi:hypothetical protein